MAKCVAHLFSKTPYLDGFSKEGPASALGHGEPHNVHELLHILVPGLTFSRATVTIPRHLDKRETAYNELFLVILLQNFIGQYIL